MTYSLAPETLSSKNIDILKKNNDILAGTLKVALPVCPVSAIGDDGEDGQARVVTFS
jgi:hypothetical protein